MVLAGTCNCQQTQSFKPGGYFQSSDAILQVCGDVITRRGFYFRRIKLEKKNVTFCCAASFYTLKCILTTNFIAEKSQLNFKAFFCIFFLKDHPRFCRKVRHKHLTLVEFILISLQRWRSQIGFNPLVRNKFKKP